MTYLAWSDDLSVGNDFIDHDHRKLIEMVNRLHVVMHEGRGKEVLGKVLNNLISYTKEHFRREEDLMRQIRYPGYFEHKEEHEKLMTQVLDLEAKFESGNTSLSIQVLHYLRDWLIHHIGESDRALATASHEMAA